MGLLSLLQVTGHRKQKVTNSSDHKILDVVLLNVSENASALNICFLPTFK